MGRAYDEVPPLPRSMVRIAPTFARFFVSGVTDDHVVSFGGAWDDTVWTRGMACFTPAGESLDVYRIDVNVVTSDAAHWTVGFSFVQTNLWILPVSTSESLYVQPTICLPSSTSFALIARGTRASQKFEALVTLYAQRRAVVEVK